MKIAISGAANTGKTTLAKGLAKQTGLPLIEEGFGEIRRGPNPDKSGDFLAGCFQKIDRAKRQLEEKYQSGFISDRCTIDLFNFWSAFPILQLRPDALEFYKNCKNHAKTYDYVVFLPWGSVAYSEIENGETSFLYRWSCICVGTR